MKQIKALDKEIIAILHKELNSVLDTILKKFCEDNGLKNYKLGHITYSPSEFSRKISFETYGVDELKEKIMDNNLSYFGLKIGDKLKHKDKEYIITGFNPRAHKSPIIMKDLKSEKSFKCSIETAKCLLIEK